MLISLLLVFLGTLFGSGSFEAALLSKEMREQVKVVMVEKDQAKAVLKDMDAMQDALDDAQKTLRKDLKEWIKSDEDHAAGKESAKLLTYKSLENRAIARKKTLDALFVMKSKMTEQQWNALFEQPQTKEK